MTVSYTADVANGSSFGCFWRILGRWRGSVYKLIWRELIAYLCLYYIINVIYRFGLDDSQKVIFEKIKIYCRKNIESIPMSFVLGFYVTLIVKRWWDQYWILPMPDSLALYISASIQGQDERGRLLRRTIMRYTMLSYIICLQRISFRVKKRFPSMEHLVETGLMTESEMKIYEKMDQKTPKVLKFWMPVVWASNLVNRARIEGRIHSDHLVQTIVTELSDFRRKLGRIMVFDNVSVPLVYTQVVTLAVYTYFVAALIGRQWVTPNDATLKLMIYPGYDDLDLYFPIFLSLQFIFYIGWLKVAETLINPFGEDDDDFELNWLIDRHIKVSYMVVDEMHEEHPELLKDQYWEQVVPQDLPYNIASERYRKSEPQGSTAALKVNPNESVYADLSSVKRHSAIPNDIYAEYECVADSPLVDGRKNWLQRQLSRVESFRSTSSSSSLFGRNRANSAINAGIGLGYHGNHRPSLYERLMNRRSSKEARHSSRGIHRPSQHGLSVPEKGFIPNSRPRVPTPDVTKENQLQTTISMVGASPSPVVKPNGIMKHNTGDGHLTSNPATTHGPSTPTTPQSPVHYIKRNQHGYTVSAVSSHPLQQPLPSAPDSSKGEGNKSALRSTTNDNQSPPPSYEQSHNTPGAIMLSTIAENDSSPYSTSSTAHTVNNSSASSSYPTTTAIFGRKPSPPPMDELPPIPTVTLSSPHGSSNSSSNSDSSSTTDSVPLIVSSQASDEPMSCVNEGYETDEGDDGRRYMTIAEVNECKAELEKSLVIKEAVPPPPPRTPELQRKPDDELVPIPVQVAPVTAQISPVPTRHGIGSIFRQDAVCLPDFGSDTGTMAVPSVSPALSVDPTVGTTMIETSLSNEILTTIKHIPGVATRIEPEEDDGYHERASYSEDDDASNHSDKGASTDSSSPQQSSRKFSGLEASSSPRSSPELIQQNTVIENVSSKKTRSELGRITSSGGSNTDTLKSDASDSDISHTSKLSVDSNIPLPSRQKPIRRRKTDSSVPKGDDSGGSDDNELDEISSVDTDSSGKSAQAKAMSKDCEVFV